MSFQSKEKKPEVYSEEDRSGGKGKRRGRKIVSTRTFLGWDSSVLKGKEGEWIWLG